MEEIDWHKLPEEEQVSDDFELFSDGSKYYAIRTRLKEGKTSFCLEAKNKWTVISMAVDVIEKAIMEFEERASIPPCLALFYIEKSDGNT